MIRFSPMPTETARHYQAGGLDANGMPPETAISDGGGNPCRHCLKMIAEGEAMLVLAHRPFPAPQPYAELGPIFLCAKTCAAGGGTELPAMLASADYILRGYGDDDRIVYGTGAVTPTTAIPQRSEALFDDPRVAYLHIRSARNNCFQCRVDRA